MTSLFIDRRDIHLELEGGALVFRDQGARLGTVPLAPLTRVFLRGSVQLPASLLGKLGEHGVGVVVLSGRLGSPTLFLPRLHNDASRRVAQVRRSFDTDFCLAFARQVIEIKLARQIAWFDDLRDADRRARYVLTQAMTRLQAHAARLATVEDLSRLRGVEGSAAHAYFEGLQAVVPGSLQFTGRNRRPPRDPFNVLLSLTYTLAHAETAILLHGAGLDPYVGFYHQLAFGRESLACDLLETVRPLADRFCLQLIREQTLNADHFSTNASGCLLGKAGRVHYYTAYEAYGAVLRPAIQAQVDALLQRIGMEPVTPLPCDDDEYAE